MIRRVGADKAPRVVPAALAAEIVSEHYFTAADGVVGRGAYPDDLGEAARPLRLLTFCVLVLRNGFTVHGVSACASPENFNAEVGERIARENAEREIWPLLGFRLRDQLTAAPHTRDRLVVLFPARLFPPDMLSLRDSAENAFARLPMSPYFPKDWSLDSTSMQGQNHVEARFTVPAGAELPSAWTRGDGVSVVSRTPLTS